MKSCEKWHSYKEGTFYTLHERITSYACFMLSRTYTAVLHGLEVKKVEVEIETVKGIPQLIIIGLPSKTVNESRERITAALLHCGIRLRSKRTVVNLAPADMKKSGSCIELAIAVGLLKLSETISIGTDDTFFIGELSLDGVVKKVPGILAFVLAAKRYGFKHIVIPAGNAREVETISDITIHPIHSIQEYIAYGRGRGVLPILQQQRFIPKSLKTKEFESIKGQYQAKRALQIALAGGHSVLLVGPPGAGKSLLAHSISNILPPLSEAEAIEVTTIHSVAGLTSQLVREPPLRMPHHTTSPSGLLGGNGLKPGEISLAHRGVLFLDELPEFSRSCLESLRQPLERGSITLTRTSGTITYPARFLLVATANPCPCGYYQSEQKPCTCNDYAISQYRRRLSGPILDRIDLFVFVKPVDLTELDSSTPARTPIKDSIIMARSVQKQRFAKSKMTANAELASANIHEFISLDTKAQHLALQAGKEMHLSARAYIKLLKVSRTIADLDHSPAVVSHHVAEALHYRSLLQ